MPDLPAPSALKAPAEMGSGLFRYGDEYESLKPHQRVKQMDGDTALFTPDWQGQASGLGGLAYAIYYLDATGYEPTSLWFDWAQQGAEEDLWIGLPSPDDTHWDWLHPYYTAGCDFNEETTFNGAAEYVVLLFTGRAAWRLNNVRLFNEVTPPRIAGVSPLGGEAGTVIQINVEFDQVWGQPKWDFGGGAVPLYPDGSDDRIVLGPAGQYQARVTASNLGGEDHFDFTLTVTGAEKLYSLRGTMRQPGGLPFAWGGVEVLGPTHAFAYTDAQGRYAAVNLLPGDYTVIPSWYLFAPYQYEVTITDTDIAGLDFQLAGGFSYSISGQVKTLPDFDPAPGVTIQLTGPVNRTVVTGPDWPSNYSFDYIPDGVYTLTVVDPGYFYAPTAATVVVAGQFANCNFLRSATPLVVYSLSGTVTDFDSGLPLAGLAVELRGFWTSTAYTAADGTYRFDNVAPAGHSINLANLDNLWDGIPANYSLTPDADRNDLDFQRKLR